MLYTHKYTHTHMNTHFSFVFPFYPFVPCPSPLCQSFLPCRYTSQPLPSRRVHTHTYNINILCLSCLSYLSVSRYVNLFVSSLSHSTPFSLTLRCPPRFKWYIHLLTLSLFLSLPVSKSISFSITLCHIGKPTGVSLTLNSTSFAFHVNAGLVSHSWAHVWMSAISHCIKLCTNVTVCLQQLSIWHRLSENC